MKKWIFCLALPLALHADPLSWEQGVRLILEAYDQGTELPKPSLSAEDGIHGRWLEAAAREPRPANPYPPQSRPWQEAEAVRHFLDAPQAKTLKALPLTLEGSRLALWRWGQAEARRSGYSTKLRLLWEDRLMEGPIDLLHFYATRHALCFSLAEGDRRRFEAIQESAPPDYADVMRMFQRAFPLLGGPCPSLRVWTLPGLENREQPLNLLGPKGAWIAPLASYPTPPPQGWAWILPTLGGSQSHQEANLEESSLKEADTIQQQLGANRAFLAPSAGELEDFLPSFFPIRLTFDEKGLITRIQVGDATLATP